MGSWTEIQGAYLSATYLFILALSHGNSPFYVSFVPILASPWQYGAIIPLTWSKSAVWQLTIQLCLVPVIASLPEPGPPKNHVCAAIS